PDAPVRRFVVVRPSQGSAQVGIAQLDEPGGAVRQQGALRRAEVQSVVLVLPGADDVRAGHRVPPFLLTWPLLTAAADTNPPSGTTRGRRTSDRTSCHTCSHRPTGTLPRRRPSLHQSVRRRRRDGPAAGPARPRRGRVDTLGLSTREGCSGMTSHTSFLIC